MTDAVATATAGTRLHLLDEPLPAAGRALRVPEVAAADGHRRLVLFANRLRPPPAPRPGSGRDGIGDAGALS